MAGLAPFCPLLRFLDVRLFRHPPFRRRLRGLTAFAFQRRVSSCDAFVNENSKS